MFRLFKKVNNMGKGVLDARVLAAYISRKYFDDYNGKIISPIKLQKSLYFCFAYWAGFVMQGKNNKSEVKTSDYSEILFDNRIEAWVYGPVIPDVYHETDIDRFYQEDIFNGKEEIKDYLDGVLDDILGVSDFRLVEISHCDESWKKNYSSWNVFHDKEISKKQIVNEYEKKLYC